MPAEAGIQLVGNDNNFKALDSRFRGKDGVFSIMTQSPRKERAYEWKGIPFTPFPVEGIF